MFLRNSMFGKASMLGLAGILAFSGCSSDANHTGTSIEDDNSVKGSIGLALRLADGSDVDTVNFTVKRNGTTVREGTLAIGADGLASGTISNLDAGSGYTIELTAPRTRDGGAVEQCTGSASFTVDAGATKTVAVVLQCSDTSPDTGNVTINGTFNICPKIGIATATPASQVVGSAIALTVTANDKDNDPLTIEWFTGATYGTGATVFATGASASFACTTPGSFQINVSAYDGAARGCRKALTTPVAVTCTGSATVDSGVPAVDSGVPAVDSGAVDSGTPAVDSGAVDSGTVDSGVPAVDSGTVPTARFGTAACDTCIAASCSNYQDFAPLLGNCVDAACDQAFACFQRNHCAVDLASVNKCYCGNVTNEECLVTGYVANGPCAQLANTTFGTTNAQTVVGLLYGEDTNFGDGAALFACAADLCTAQCVTATNIPAP
ncbi:MAG TPA: hypothetical protein VI299_08115 [Polyangiales bacterium]